MDAPLIVFERNTSCDLTIYLLSYTYQYTHTHYAHTCIYYLRFCTFYAYDIAYIYIYTSPGRKFALLEGLSHDLKSAPDRFIMSILRGRFGTVNYHPVLNLIN